MDQEANICSSCHEPIKQGDPVMTHNGRVVCARCKDEYLHPVFFSTFAQMAPPHSPEPVKIEDLAGPLPPAPTFQWRRMKAYKRVKITIYDPEANQLTTGCVDVRDEVRLTEVIAFAREQFGAEVRKITILKRQWLDSNELTKLEKVGIVAGILHLFGAL